MKFLLALIVSLLLVVTTSEAATYYVATTGNNSNPGTEASPKLTIAAGIALMSGGDTLYLRGGTYNDFIDNSGYTIPSGTISNYTKIWAYPGETVTLAPSTDRGYVIALYRVDQLGGRTDEYIHFDRLIIDASAQQGGTNPQGVSIGQNRIRLTDMEVFGAGNTDYPGNGVSAGGNNSEIYGTTPGACNLHDNGKHNHAPFNSGGYGIYVVGNDWQIYNCKIHHNGGYGAHVAHDVPTVLRAIISRNEFYSNRQIAISTTAAILLSAGNGHAAFGNVIHDEPGGGIQIYNGCSNCLVYNNTMYNIGWFGIRGEAGTGSVFRNNIIYNVNGVNNGSSAIEDSTGATKSDNLCYGTTTSTTNCQITGQDPLFVNAGSSNFRLQAGSPAIDKGFILGVPYNVDFTGAPRPQGGGWDLGAYEYAPAVTVPSPQLVLALPLDDGPSSIAIDVSGQKNNATLIGGATWDNSGVYGKAIMLDGTGYLNIPASASLALAPAMTLEAWVYPTAAPSGLSSVIVQNRYYLYAASDAGQCPALSLAPIGGYSTTVIRLLCATSMPPLNQWSHLAVTHDGLTMIFYLNGNPVASQSSIDPMVPVTYPLTIGASSFGENFIGKIDQPMVYNYARTRPQILSDMSTPLIGAPGKYVEIAAPVSVEISAASSIEISAD